MLWVIADGQEGEIALETIQDILEGKRVRPFQVLEVFESEGGPGGMQV